MKINKNQNIAFTSKADIVGEFKSTPKKSFRALKKAVRHIRKDIGGENVHFSFQDGMRLSGDGETSVVVGDCLILKRPAKPKTFCQKLVDKFLGNKEKIDTVVDSASKEDSIDSGYIEDWKSYYNFAKVLYENTLTKVKS